jgi:hypothetical protein
LSVSHSTGSGKWVHAPEAVFHSGNHPILDVLGGDAGGRRHVSHPPEDAAVECEGNPNLLAVSASDRAHRSTSAIPPVDCHKAIVAPFLTLFVVMLEEQPVILHDAVDPTWIRRCAPGRLGLASQQGKHAMVPVGRQLGDGCPSRGQATSR